MLGQDIDLVLVFAGVFPQFDLRQHLIGEGGAHHEAGVACRAAKIDQTPFGENDQALAIRKLDFINLRFDIVPAIVPKRIDLDFAIEMANVADDGAIFHVPHMIQGDDVDIAGRGDENIAIFRGLIEGDDFISFHRRLQRADRIDFRDQDTGALTAKRGRGALADIAIAADNGNLARNHHVRCALDAVHKAFAATIEVVEF